MKDIVKHSVGCIVLIALLSACSLHTGGVTYAEMAKKPIVSIAKNNRIIVKTENSCKNSALSISAITHRVDTAFKAVYLSGIQTVKQRKDTAFCVSVENVVDDIGRYRFFWIDPDGKTTEIEVLK